jgi:hypothetical protein
MIVFHYSAQLQHMCCERCIASALVRFCIVVQQSFCTVSMPFVQPGCAEDYHYICCASVKVVPRIGALLTLYALSRCDHVFVML